MGDRKLMWCAEHGEPAWLYSDGSHSCWHDCIVEATTEHALVELPEIERLRAAGDALASAFEEIPQWPEWFYKVYETWLEVRRG